MSSPPSCCRFRCLVPRLVDHAPTRPAGHAPDPATLPWPDNKVRAIFREDWQLVLGIFGMYGGVYVLYKIKSAFSKKAPPAPAIGA